MENIEPKTQANLMAIHRRAASAGISSMAQLLVLDAIMSATDLENDLVTVSLSQYEMASMTGLPVSTVVRALAKLRDLGLIARKQATRIKGCVAFTSVMSKGLAIYSRNVVGRQLLPEPVRDALVGASASVSLEVATAWCDLRVPAAPVDESFPAGSQAWEVIEHALRLHVLEEGEDTYCELLAEQHSAEAAANGQVTLELQGGEVAYIHAPTFHGLAPSPTDLRFVAEALQCAQNKGLLLTKETLARYVAEAAYSRTVGFLRGRPWDESVRILASVISRPNWGRPRSIRKEWYAAASRAVHGSLSTASPVSYH